MNWPQSKFVYVICHPDIWLVILTIVVYIFVQDSEHSETCFVQYNFSRSYKSRGLKSICIVGDPLLCILHHNENKMSSKSNIAYGENKVGVEHNLYQSIFRCLNAISRDQQDLAESSQICVPSVDPQTMRKIIVLTHRILRWFIQKYCVCVCVCVGGCVCVCVFCVGVHAY